MPRLLKNLIVFSVIMGAAVLISMALSGIHDDNNPFAMPLFILAVVLIARLTDGYLCGIAASLVGTFCVNYMFTYPFWEFDITLTGYPLTFATMLGVSLMVSALTTQIKRQEQLRYEADREKMYANLLRAVAHDIRTPLAAILGASSALRERELPKEDQATLLEGIDRDARWLVRVTENLLSVTRFTGGNATVKKTDEVLEEIVGSAVVKYHRSPDALPVRVDEPERILIVPMDGVLIEQVLVNLFDNVTDHAKTATRIWLHIAVEPEQVVLTVEDDGVGIPLGARKTLFDGSAHAAESRGDGKRNMGIGLSVCRSIVRAHGGDMRAGESDHGGAAIRFTLPCTEDHHAQ